MDGLARKISPANSAKVGAITLVVSFLLAEYAEVLKC